MEAKRDYYNVVQDAIFDAIQISLGLTDAEANAFIRYVSPSGESQPLTLAPDENRCYVRLGGIALSGVGSKDRLYEDVEAGVEKTIRMLDGLTAFLVFYGPDAATYAQKTQVGLHEDTVREKLRMDGIALVDNSPTPVWLPELYNGNWLNRCDLEVRLYRMVEYTETLPAVQVVPEIIIRRDI